LLSTSYDLPDLPDQRAAKSADKPVFAADALLFVLDITSRDRSQ